MAFECKALWIALWGAALLAAHGAWAEGAPIQIEVSGVRSAMGTIRIDVCTADTFLKPDCPYWGRAPAVQGMTTVVIPDVPPGTYAAQVYHDVNDNHRVDRGLLGIPVEDIGFTNDAPLGLTGPKFAKAAFVHTDVPQILSLKLRHFGPSHAASADSSAAQ
jgi:uncharacterized protein (DUF2141 family)